MKVALTNAISPYYNQKQTKISNSYQTTFTSKTDILNDTVSLGNFRILENVINNAFDNSNSAGIMTMLKNLNLLQPLFSSKIPYFYKNSSCFPFKCSIDCVGLNGKGLSISGDATGKKSFYRINNFIKSPLHVSRNTINKYQGPEGAVIIGDGMRDGDPAKQKNWKHVLGAEWPPSELTRKNVVPVIDNSGHAIIQNTSADVIDAYGTIPRSMVILPDNNSIVTISQQTVYKSPKTISQLENVDNTWQSWAIHPLALKPNKETLIVIPLKKGETENYLSEEMIKSGQWSIDKTGKFALFKASMGSPKSECIKKADWCIVSTEGDNNFNLFRSYRPADQGSAISKFYSASEKDGGKAYVEVEFFGPETEPGKTSTLIHRVDQIDRKRLELPPIKSDNIKDVTLDAAEQILSKMEK